MPSTCRNNAKHPAAFKHVSASRKEHRVQSLRQGDDHPPGAATKQVGTEDPPTRQEVNNFKGVGVATARFWQEKNIRPRREATEVTHLRSVPTGVRRRGGEAAFHDLMTIRPQHRRAIPQRVLAER